MLLGGGLKRPSRCWHLPPKTRTSPGRHKSYLLLRNDRNNRKAPCPPSPSPSAAVTPATAHVMVLRRLTQHLR